MNSQELKKYNIPDKSGVYFFLKGKTILYIGKATSLRDRVKSYFGKDLISTRGPAILDMVTQTDKIEWQEADSVLEALILEANLIKKYQPKYNTKDKDNKSFNYVCITKEDLPKVLIVRGRGINFNQKSFFSGPRTKRAGILPDHSKNVFLSEIFGPFPNGPQLKVAMKIIRPIFPYLDNDSNKKNNREFYRQLGLVPVIGFTSPRNTFQKGLGSPRRILLEARPDHSEKYFSASLREYKNNIKNLKLFFQGKKKNILINFKKDMAFFAKNKEFEKALEVKKKIFAIEHINDISLIKEDSSMSDMDKVSNFRIEAYDVAHMNGKDMVGVMTVIENGEIKKSDYKKFIIKTQDGANDTGALDEILRRRLRHTEWALPSVIVVDGGKAQINVAKNVLKTFENSLASQENIFQKVLGSGKQESDLGLLEKDFLVSFHSIKIVSVLKDEKHKPKSIMGDENIIKKYKKDILLANSESHRFAIDFHKQKRNKSFIKK